MYSTAGGVELTQSQVLHLEQIESRDQELDNQLDQISQLLDDLNNIALVQKEELKKQNDMVIQINDGTDETLKHVISVNKKIDKFLK